MQIRQSGDYFLVFSMDYDDDYAEWNRLLQPITISYHLTDSLAPAFVCRREAVEQSPELMWLILGRDIQ